MDFEVHVTVAEPRPPAQEGWVLSVIDGDPVGRFIYTRHEATYEQAVSVMEELVDRLGTVGLRVRRRKIEHVVFDERDGGGA